MDILSILKFIIGFFVSVAGISTVLIYLGKLLINKSLDLAVEKYRSNLVKELEIHKSKLGRDTEEFKMTLNRIVIEHQIRFSKLHEDRALVVKEMYCKIYNLEKSLLHLTSLFQGPEWTEDRTREEDSITRLDDLKEHLELNRIYLEEAYCNDLDILIDDCLAIVRDMRKAKSRQKLNKKYEGTTFPIKKEQLMYPTEKWMELEDKVKKDLKPKRLEIVNKFRTILGLENLENN